MKTDRPQRKVEHGMKHREISAIGQASFARLARELGLKPQHYTRTDEWLKNDANRLHVVQRYDCDGGMSVVLKQAFRPEDPRVGFMLLVQILTDWNRMQPDPVCADQGNRPPGLCL